MYVSRATPSGNYRKLLADPGFESFLWTQFLGAFNDNVYKMIVSLLAASLAVNQHAGARYLALAGAAFVLPYLLFAGHAGQIADRFSKTRVLQITKALEIVTMLLGLSALITNRIDLLLGVLFLLGMQANFFSPAKYGILPEMMGEAELSAANGLVEFSTLAAIVLGTSFGSFLIDIWKHNPYRLGGTLLAIAIVGTLCSLFISRVPASGSSEPFRWNPFHEIWIGFKRLRQNRALALTVLGLSYFWFIGALFQMAVLLMGSEALHETDRRIGLLVTALAFGIGVGSIAAGWISRKHIELGLVPLGSLLLGIFSIVLSVTHSYAWDAFWLAAIGFSGGLFFVPLNAFLQERSDPQEKGRLLATNNFVNMLGIIFASGLLSLLHDKLHWSAAWIIAALGLLTILATVHVVSTLPANSLRPEDTLGYRLVRAARRKWSQPAIADSTKKELTYGKTLIAAILVRNWLQQEHAGEAHIGLLLPASVGGAIANFGVTLAGRAAVNLNFTAGEQNCRSAVEQCGIRTVLTSRVFLEKANLPEWPEMVFVEDLLPRFRTPAKLRAVLAARLVPARQLIGRVAADDVATVLFSSGSTGVPKGIELTHWNIITNIENAASVFPMEGDHCMLGVLPLFHSFGYTFALWFPVVQQIRAAFHPNPMDAQAIGDLARKHRATFFLSTPTFCAHYIRKCTAEQFQTLRYILVGAEKLRASVAEEFQKKFGVGLLAGYGATELGPCVSVNTPGPRGIKNGSVGRPLPGISIRIVHPEARQPLAPGEQGMLLVKSPSQMKGYHNAPEKTAQAMHDGFYITGDLAYVDEDGFLFITDRLARFSKIGGEMVPHLKIEEAVSGILGDAHAFVTGIADERRGERLLMLYTSPEITPAQLIERLNAAGLPQLWIPKRENFYLVDTIPVLGTGKVDLAKARALATESASAFSAK